MLGYRELAGEITSDEDAIKAITFLESNKLIIESQDNQKTKELYRDSYFDLYEYYEIKTAFISDSIIITYKPKEIKNEINQDLVYLHSANSLFIITNRLHLLIYNCLTEYGIFLRGGVSNKFCEIESNFIVGEGLIEAYETEREIAKYPRISLAKSVTDNIGLLEAIRFLEKNMYDSKPLARKDNDGTYFIDYLAYALSPNPKLSTTPRSAHSILNEVHTAATILRVHKENITKSIDKYNRSRQTQIENNESTEKVERIISKYNWLKNYYNNTVSLEKFIPKQFLIKEK